MFSSTVFVFSTLIRQFNIPYLISFKIYIQQIFCTEEFIFTFLRSNHLFIVPLQVSSEDDVPIFTRTMKTLPFEMNIPTMGHDSTEVDDFELEKCFDAGSTRLNSADAATSMDTPFDSLSNCLSAAQRMLTELERPTEKCMPFSKDLSEFSCLTSSSKSATLNSGSATDRVTFRDCGNKENRLSNVCCGVQSTDTTSEPSCALSLKEKSRNLVSMYIPEEPLKLFRDCAVGKFTATSKIQSRHFCDC